MDLMSPRMMAGRKMKAIRYLQGYLAHKKPPAPIGPPHGPKHGPTVGSKRAAVSYEQHPVINPRNR